MSTNPLIQHGAQLERPPHEVPIWTNRFFTGLWTQRNPLRDAATPYLYEKFYSGSRYDSLIGGVNCEISNRLTLIRRPGLTVYNTSALANIKRFYAFKKFSGSSESIQLISSVQTINGPGEVWDDTGPGTNSRIFLGSAGSVAPFFQSVGNVLYFGDGIDQQKYLQTGSGWTTQNWGIDGSQGSNTAGPTIAGTGANGGGSGAAWSNPGNVTSNVSFATVTTSAPGTQTQPPLTGGVIAQGVGPLGSGSVSTTGTAFGFTLPSTATVNGIQVTFTRNVSIPGLAGAGTFTDSIQLVKAGTPTGTVQGPGSGYTTTPTSETWGGPTDLWGTSWAFTDINNALFGFTMTVDYDNSSGSSGVVHDYQTTITVYYTNGSGASFSQSLIASTFGFSVSNTLTPSGVAVSFNAGATAFDYLSVYLVVNGSPVGLPKQLSGLPSSPTSFTLGASSDTWGYAGLTSSLVNMTNFGFAFVASNGAATTSVNDVQVTIYASGAPGVSKVGTGTFSATTGYEYVYCYGNSITGHVSNPSPASQNTGSFTNIDHLAVTVAASPDPQVNQIRVFRTTDGGSIFFELPTSPYPNSSATITDNAGDPGSANYPQLNAFSEAPTGGDNAPPPAGLINLEYHNQRIWGSVGNTVYYSLAPNTNIGVGAESFPPLQSFVYPSLVTKLKATSVGLLVFTISDLYIILGDGSANPYYTTIFCYKLGLASYDAMTEIGSDLAMMCSNGEVVRFNPQSSVNSLTGIPTGTVDKTEIGFPIGDILTETYNPSTTYVTWHIGSSVDKALYVSDGTTGWYRWAFNQAPENAPAWSPQAQISGGCGCVQSVEVTPGVWKLLVAPPGSIPGNILMRDLSTNADNGTDFSWFANIGNIVLAQPGQLAEVDFIAIDANASGSPIGAGVLLNEISGSFGNFSSFVPDPTYLPQSVSVTTERFYLSSKSTLPRICRYLQIQLNGGVANTADEVLSYSMYGSIRNER